MVVSAASCQHGAVPTQCHANTTECQHDIATKSEFVPTLCLAKRAPCKGGIVPTGCRVKTAPCQDDTAFRRSCVKAVSFQTMPRQDNIVSRRCRVITMSCEKKQGRVKTMPRQNVVVATRCRAKTTSCQDDVVSKRCGLNTASCQYDSVPKLCRIKNDAVPTFVP